MQKDTYQSMYEKIKNYFNGKALRIGTALAITLGSTGIANANNPKPLPVKKDGIEYVLNEIGNEFVKFGQNCGKLVYIIHKQPTVDQLTKNPDAKVNDYLAKGVTFIPSLFIDPVYGIVAFAQDPGKALEDTVKNAIKNPIETGLRVVGYAVIGKAIRDSHGHGRGGAGGEEAPPGPPKWPSGGPSVPGIGGK